jgi:hypothetical protein
MLIMYVMDQPSKWEYYIHLVNFSYNNGYQASLKIIPFETLYSRKCNTPVSWDNPADRAVIGLDLLKEMEVWMARIRKNLKLLMKRNSCPNTNIFKSCRLRQDSRDCYPMFIALLQNYQLTFKKYVLEINVVFYIDL